MFYGSLKLRMKIKIKTKKEERQLDMVREAGVEGSLGRSAAPAAEGCVASKGLRRAPRSTDYPEFYRPNIRLT